MQYIFNFVGQVDKILVSFFPSVAASSSCHIVEEGSEFFFFWRIAFHITAFNVLVLYVTVHYVFSFVPQNERTLVFFTCNITASSAPPPLFFVCFIFNQACIFSDCPSRHYQERHWRLYL